MCGRYVLATTSSTAAQLLGADGLEEPWGPRYSIAPTNRVPVIRQADGGGEARREAVLARWGFKPARAEKLKFAPINARLETAAAKWMFAREFQDSRVVIPMTGYYEWVDLRTAGKQPYYLHNEDESLLAAAGLYTVRESENGPEASCTILTRTGIDAAGDVHDRMPAFLTEDLINDWLNPSDGDAEAMTEELTHASEKVAATIRDRPVSRRVNSVQNLNAEDPGLIKG